MKTLFKINALIALFLLGCQTQIETDVTVAEEVPILSTEDIADFAVAYSAATTLKKDASWWKYQTGFTWLKGANFKDSGQIDVTIMKMESRIRFNFYINVAQLGEYPTVYNSDFHKNEIADRLELSVTFKNNQNRRSIKRKADEKIDKDGNVNFVFYLTTNDFNNLEVGMMDYSVDIKTEFVSFFGKHSGVKPISAAIALPFSIPTVYKTQLYFGEVVLNKGATNILLGDNDWSNGTPETGILIKYDGETVLYDFTKNSYSHKKSATATIHHIKEDDVIELSILDVDYGFNGNDIICDTIIRLKALESDGYLNLPLNNTDTLLIYTKAQGRVN